jgi:tetratricopeptide (TPR) repeat protein
MKPSRSVTLVAGSLLAICFCASAMLIHFVDRLRPQVAIEDVLYLKSSTLKRMSLGYTGLVADIYWTRAVQYYGSGHVLGASHYDLLAPLLNITTDLDPKLQVAYEYGSAFLSPPPPAGAGQPDEAVALVKKGIDANPDSWRLYRCLGFLHFMDRQDYDAAAKAFQRGSELPNAHPGLKILAGRMAQKAGDLETARLMWGITYDTAQAESIKENAALHLIAIQVAEDVAGLEKIVDLYRTQTGHFPSGFRDLATANMLAGIPADPYGQAYVFNADGTVVVRHPEKFKFLMKGLPKGYTPPVNARD